MNYLEEQKSELEALSEIYHNEITIISNKPPISFSIKIRAQASGYDNVVPQTQGEESDEDESNFNKQEEEFIKILFTLPPKYPDTKPSLELLSSSGLEPLELENLLSLLDSKCQEYIGCVMTFSLVNDVVEWLIKRSDKQEVDSKQKEDLKDKELERLQQKRFDGTPVTKETFLAWKAKFDVELLKIKLEQQSLQASSGPKKMTGREMFENDKTLIDSDVNLETLIDDSNQDYFETLLEDVGEGDEDLSDFDPGEFLQDAEEVSSDESE